MIKFKRVKKIVFTDKTPNPFRPTVGTCSKGAVPLCGTEDFYPIFSEMTFCTFGSFSFSLVFS
jgi:hypothetical protein